MEKVEEIRDRNMYVDLDSIFDTRLPLVYLLSPEIGVSVTKDNSYYRRYRDSFGNISQDIFSAIYRKRQKMLLKLATPTGLITEVIRHYGDEVTGVEQSIASNRPVIYINLYPYDLDQSEKDVMFFMLNKIIPNSVIEFIFMDKLEVNPRWITDNSVGALFKYDGVEWLDTHVSNANLLNLPLLTTTLIAPALMLGNLKSSRVDKTVFENLMYSAGTVIDLQLIDAVHFSNYIPKKETST